MPLETTRVNGKVHLPTGPAPGGEILIRLSEPGSVSDGTQTHTIVGQAVALIEPDGSVDFTLVPNSVIAPAGTHYVVEYVFLGGTRKTEKWNVGTTPDPIAIGDIPIVP